MTTNYSVEYALPYNQDLSSKHAEFDLAFSGLSEKFKNTGQTFKRVLLVDDVTSGIVKDSDIQDYIEASTSGESVLVMRESALNDLSDKVYEQLKQTSHTEVIEKYKNGDRYTSPFYIAIWSLLRLGYLEHPEFPKDYVGEKIINILPESWRTGEEESMAILARTQYSTAQDRVDYIYV